jgi:hypothetical protein
MHDMYVSESTRMLSLIESILASNYARTVSHMSSRIGMH